MNCEIIAIGQELLMGEITDTNSPFIARELAKANVTVSRMTNVGDDIEDLTESFKNALAGSDMVFACGGLGPTSDDLTREATASVVAETPEVDPDLLKWLEGVFADRGFSEMPKSNIKQAWLIPSAKPIHNPLGTAPGWWVEKNGKIIVLMPGPPRELQRMWQESLLPMLEKLSTGERLSVSTVKTFGMTEGDVDNTLKDLFGKENPYLGIYARRDGIHLRIIARAPSTIAAEKIALEAAAEIERRLPRNVWGRDDDLPGTAVARIIKRNHLTLGVAEGVSAGFISSMMTEAKAENSFLGSLVIGKGASLNDPVLKNLGGSVNVVTDSDKTGYDTALSMAQTARQLLGSDLGLGVAPVLSGLEPDRPGSVYVGMTSDRGENVSRNSFARGRVHANERAALFALVEMAGWLNSTYAS